MKLRKDIVKASLLDVFDFTKYLIKWVGSIVLVVGVCMYLVFFFSSIHIALGVVFVVVLVFLLLWALMYWTRIQDNKES